MKEKILLLFLMLVIAVVLGDSFIRALTQKQAIDASLEMQERSEYLLRKKRVKNSTEFYQNVVRFDLGTNSIGWVTNGAALLWTIPESRVRWNTGSNQVVWVNPPPIQKMEDNLERLVGILEKMAENQK